MSDSRELVLRVCWVWRRGSAPQKLDPEPADQGRARGLHGLLDADSGSAWGAGDLKAPLHPHPNLSTPERTFRNLLGV